MPLTKRNYEVLSQIICNLTVDQSGFYYRDELTHQHHILYRDELIAHLAQYFLEDNSRFDAERFQAACTREVSNAR